MASSASGVSKKPLLKPLQLSHCSTKHAGGGAATTSREPSLIIQPRPRKCIGKEGSENMDFLQDLHLFHLKALPREELDVARQKKQRHRLDMKMALTAMEEMDAEFEMWMRDSERRSVDAAEAEAEIRRIVRAQGRRSSCEISSTFAPPRSEEEGGQVVQPQEELVQKKHMSEVSSCVRSHGWLNYFKRTLCKVGRRSSELLPDGRGVVKAGNAMTVGHGCGIGRRWLKATKGGYCKALRQRCCFVVPYYYV